MNSATLVGARPVVIPVASICSLEHIGATRAGTVSGWQSHHSPLAIRPEFVVHPMSSVYVHIYRIWDFN
jgi:hypothetical protein